MADIKSINGNQIKVGADGVEDGAITAAKLATDAVITEKIADGAVTPEKLSGFDLPHIETRVDYISEETYNLWQTGDVSIGESGWVHITLAKPLPAGTYTFSALVTSDASSTLGSYVGFIKTQSGNVTSSDIIAAGTISRGQRSSLTVTLTDTVYRVRLCTLNSVSASSGYESEWADVQISTLASAPYKVPFVGVDSVARETMDDVIEDMGHNLFDFPNVAHMGGWTEGQDGSWTGKISTIDQSMRYVIHDGGGEEGVRYTVSLTALCANSSTSGNGLRIMVRYADAPDTNVAALTWNRNTTSYSHKTYTTTEGKTVYSMTVTVANGASTDMWSIKDFQLEKGAQETPYVPYGEKTAIDRVARSTSPALPPTGDTTDRSYEITQRLADGWCELGPGVFYVSGVTMPDESTLSGAGASTKLVMLDGDGACVTMGSRCTLKDMAIVGGTDIELDGTIGNRHGVYVGGDGTQRGTIDNVLVSGFSGAGIRLYDTGYASSSSCQITNVRAFNNEVGLYIQRKSEYNRICNCEFGSNYYGAINNGGNNKIANCNFDSNVTGMLFDNSQGQSDNNTHGSVTNCTFNHNDSNAGYALKMYGCRSGEMFVGCQFFYGSILLDDSQGVVLSACNFGRSEDGFVINGGDAHILAGCMFTGISAGFMPFTITNNNKVHFVGCYTRDGTHVDPTA